MLLCLELIRVFPMTALHTGLCANSSHCHKHYGDCTVSHAGFHTRCHQVCHTLAAHSASLYATLTIQCQTLEPPNSGPHSVTAQCHSSVLAYLILTCATPSVSHLVSLSITQSISQGHTIGSMATVSHSLGRVVSHFGVCHLVSHSVTSPTPPHSIP